MPAIAEQDGFNWGYDPLHYTTPEGSYATNPEGTDRTAEFRRMVQGLNGAGLRVVIDVVYNHTPAAGQDPKSILDRVVPGYYQRLNPTTGAVETSSCCANTATEHAMMEKLMIDSVLTWAKEYKLDGFRFDLMGHQPKSAMQNLRRALDKLTLAKDGVDGRKIYLYGEGWNFGEVANNARFVQATQLEMAGTGIGSFNDRLRDAVRGGGPFDENPRIQGFASGQYTDSNGDPVNGTADEQKAALLLNQDRIKVGLTGNLRDYRFVDRTGARVTGAEVDYNGQPTGYTTDPQEVINYVEAHDNEALYDALVYKLPTDTSMADRIRMQTLALSTTALSQGVSFWHAGGEILRSKSLDRNSYDSGDWFNVLDYLTKPTDLVVGYRRRPITKRNGRTCARCWPIPPCCPTRPRSGRPKRRHARCCEIRENPHCSTWAPKDSCSRRCPSRSAGPIRPRASSSCASTTLGTERRSSAQGARGRLDRLRRSHRSNACCDGRSALNLHPVQANGSDPVVKTATTTLEPDSSPSQLARSLSSLSDSRRGW